MSLTPRVGSVGSNGNLVVRVTDTGPSPKVLVQWKGKTYEVEVFKKNHGGSETAITYDRDWSDVAKDVLTYLESLEGTSSGPGEAFAFAQMKSANVVLQGGVSTTSTSSPSTSSPSILEVKWDTTVTQNSSKVVQLSSISGEAQNKISQILPKLGQSLATYKPYIPPRVTPMQTTPLDTSSHTLISLPTLRFTSSTLPSKPQLRPVREVPDYYPSDKLVIETGGRGNCGAYALADAMMQKTKTYYTPEDWKKALEYEKGKVRGEAMEYLFNNTDKFLSDNLFAEVLSAIHDSKDDIIARFNGYRETLNKLLDKPEGTLLPEEKKWLIQLYALYAKDEGKDLDKPFFLAYALCKNERIAVIQNNQIIFVAPPTDKRININDYLFVNYNGSNHFRSVNRQYTGSQSNSLNRIISRYNESQKAVIARNQFLDALASSTNIRDKLLQLKDQDPHGYLVIVSLVEKDIVEKAINGNPRDSDLFIEALKLALRKESGGALREAVELRINQRTDIETFVRFISSSISILDSQVGTPQKQEQMIEQIDKLRRHNFQSYSNFCKIILRVYNIDISKISNPNVFNLLVSSWGAIKNQLGIEEDMTPSQKTLGFLEELNKIYMRGFRN